MNDLYTTSDIYVASTLASLDYVIENITQNNNKFIFHINKPLQFPAPFNAEIDADMYWQHNLLVDPQRLFTEFKSLKSRMYDIKRSEKR